MLDRSIILNDVMSAIREMVVDNSQHVRASVATHVSGLAPLLGKDKYVVNTS